MAAQHFFAKAWSLSFGRFSKKIRDFVKNLLLKSINLSFLLFLNGYLIKEIENIFFRVPIEFKETLVKVWEKLEIASQTFTRVSITPYRNTENVFYFLNIYIYIYIYIYR
jgi:hypothetical protein